VAARNLGFAFIVASFGGITRIRFKGFLSPARRVPNAGAQDPCVG